MTTVHLPSGLAVQVANHDVRANLADYCPQRQEHTPARDRRWYMPVIHAPCGLPVVWVPKGSRRRA